VLREYVDHDDRQPPHRGLGRRVPHGEGTEPVVKMAALGLDLGKGADEARAALRDRQRAVR